MHEAIFCAEIFFVGDFCPNSGTIDLVGTTSLNVGETGFFICTTINSLLLVWTLNQESVIFIGVDEVGTSVDGSSITAHLVNVNLDQDSLIGNRTSFLVYTPEPGFTGPVSVSCNGGRVDTPCVVSVGIIGKCHIRAIIIT